MLPEDAYEPPVTLDRVATTRGELVLRAAGDRFEIISNGVFLMDTSDGRSERLLVDAAMARCVADEPRLLIGGLGVGFSLIRATNYDRVAAIDVIEIETAIIDWHARFLKDLTGTAIADPRVRVIESDVLDWLERATERYDVICLDTDNGPNWLVNECNADLYGPRGLGLAYRCLRPGGLLAVWSASRDPAYEGRLRSEGVEFEVFETPQDRGTPDVVYLAQWTGAGGVAGCVAKAAGM